MLAALGGLCVAIVSITGPVARWGAVGLMLTFGVLIATGGAIAWAVGDVGSETVAALGQDNDGDGRTNEDPPGDSDRSNADPTEVNGLAEATNPADDDGDGIADEDPAEPEGVRDVTDRVASIGKVGTFVGVGLLLGFGVLGWKHEQARAERDDRAAASPTRPRR